MIISRPHDLLSTVSQWGGHFLCGALLLLFGFRSGAAWAQPADQPVMVYEAPRPAAGDAFGTAIGDAGAIDEDRRSELIVGAPHASIQGRDDAGRVYLLRGRDGTMLRTIESPSPEVDGLFGYAVAGIGDVTGDGTPDIAVGAAGDSSNVGRAYLIDGTDGKVLHTLTSPNKTADGLFGRSLVPLGDVTDDGVPDLLASAIGEDRVYLIDGAKGQIHRTLSVPSEGHAHFGHVAVLTDVTGDGTSDVLVGASSSTVGERSEAGRAHLFNGSDGTLLRTLTEPSPEHGNFGYFVTSLGDVNGDGTQDMAVGAASGPEKGGTIYLYSGADGTLLHTVSPPAPSEDGYFGYSGIGIRNADHEGRPGILLGTRVPAADGERAGRAYLLGHNGDLLRTLTAPENEPGTQFGSTLATVTTEDENAALIGAPRADVNGTAEAGRVYRFSLP